MLNERGTDVTDFENLGRSLVDDDMCFEWFTLDGMGM